MRSWILILAYASSASAVPADATDFSSCPYFPDPLPSTPPNTDTDIIHTQKKSPFGAATFDDGDKKWLFVSTGKGVLLYNAKQLHDPHKLITHRPAKGMDISVSKKLLVIATADGEPDGDSFIQFIDLRHLPDAPPAHADLKVAKPTCQLDGTGKPSDENPSLIDVAISPHHPDLAFTANECDTKKTGARGSVDVIDLDTFAKIQQVQVDYAPAGLAARGDLLLVANERYGDVSIGLGGKPGGKKVGSVITFDIGDKPHPLTPLSAVNAGCDTTRVVIAGDGRAYASARFSNQVYVFDTSRLSDEKKAAGARIGFFTVGPEPVGLQLFDNDLLLGVANSFRFDEPETASYREPSSTMVFKTDDVRTQPGSVQTLTPCLVSGQLNPGHGDFLRNLAANDKRLFVTLFRADAFRHFQIEDIERACFPPPPSPCAGKNLLRDAKNCGACGHACPGDIPCQSGHCCEPCKGGGPASCANSPDCSHIQRGHPYPKGTPHPGNQQPE